MVRVLGIRFNLSERVLLGTDLQVEVCLQYAFERRLVPWLTFSLCDCSKSRVVVIHHSWSFKLITSKNSEKRALSKITLRRVLATSQWWSSLSDESLSPISLFDYRVNFIKSNRILFETQILLKLVPRNTVLFVLRTLVLLTLLSSSNFWIS